MSPNYDYLFGSSVGESNLTSYIVLRYTGSENHPKVISSNGCKVFIRENKFRKKPFSQPNLSYSLIIQRKLNSYPYTIKYVFSPTPKLSSAVYKIDII